MTNLNLQKVDVSFGDKTTISIPDYMSCLSAQDLKETIQFSDAKDRIIACGTTDESMMIITGDGNIFEFEFKLYHIPPGEAIPMNFGKFIFFPNIDGRWPGHNVGYYLDSSWMISHSQPELNDIDLVI
jgi:hypothetical protein